MTQEEINSYYEKFKISEDVIPNYENPREFAMQFERCTVLKYVNTTYTSSIFELKMDKREDKNA
ncbi:hypothetical protein ACFL5N_00920 [bacterium]